MGKKKRRIAWADSPLHECGHSWDAKEGETIEYTTGTVAARGPHRCVKQAGHESDPTNDDHQCCCGNSTWVS